MNATKLQNHRFKILNIIFFCKIGNITPILQYIFKNAFCHCINELVFTCDAKH